MFMHIYKHLTHLQDALLLALGNCFSNQSGEAVFAHFIHLEAVIFKMCLVV